MGSNRLVKAKPKVTVVGSINVDLVVSSPKWPAPGETIEGGDFNVFLGGKGANQAVAAARFGGEVTMLGAIADDDYGSVALENLKINNINVDHLKISQRETTGKAIITVVNTDNSIIYIPGANNKIDTMYIKDNIEHLSSSNMVLMQNEIPFAVQQFVVKYCYQKGIPLIYNPAPAREIDSWLLDKVSYVTPNEHEFSLIADKEKYLDKIICTMGARGVEYSHKGIKYNIPSYKVEIVDTTGAGDTFNGVLAVELASGRELHEALQTANMAAALSITKNGAQDGMPTREKFIQNRNQLIYNH
ncbi:ribokinase [Bacillus sp. SD088]|uniref:ribokinase n=1 Tax=Bacillus sp. SD088 TaxID=2782012 RepID=UPI001F62347F|nr:ribokinase [Bacillus sp. SD088]